ncbi:hypothetical protein DBV15_03906 [Temnothorax longispinosus]|uniref:Uncharacterized protein n=1 Tax=Temnothorax longispinosus TaxID=300112 RepID=A0A4S2KQ03_9HYME|nr:hypothetical protein DBV15_03906 [Temnothorax longispinosus]
MTVYKDSEDISPVILVGKLMHTVHCTLTLLVRRGRRESACIPVAAFNYEHHSLSCTPHTFYLVASPVFTLTKRRAIRHVIALTVFRLCILHNCVLFLRLLHDQSISRNELRPDLFVRHNNLVAALIVIAAVTRSLDLVLLPPNRMLRFQSLLDALPQRASNSLGVYQSEPSLIHRPLPPEPNLLLCNSAFVFLHLIGSTARFAESDQLYIG